MCCGKNRFFLSFLFIGFGILFLFNNFGFLGNPDELLFATAFGCAGLIGMATWVTRKRHWWLLIPSSIALGVAGIMTVQALPFIPNALEPAAIFFPFALGFWLIFITQEKHWWAAMPAGLFTSLGFFITVDEFMRIDTPFILFIGFGLTFYVLWLIRKAHPTSWAKWPALVFFGLSILVSMAESAQITWPLILIGVGAWLFLRNMKLRQKTEATV